MRRLVSEFNYQLSRFRLFVTAPDFPRKYAWFSVIVLLVTTLFWALLGASLQRSNADQLINTYLFENSGTFHGAFFPGSHTQLIKWPLFWLIKAFGASGFIFAAFTVGLVLITVGSLAAIIYWAERRPLVFGSLYLALASVLLLVPAQPQAGGLLPVNMAMVATRNLEYLIYIASLVLIIRWPRIKSWRFWLAVVLLSLLIASDRLFLLLSLGGALLALIAYALGKGWNLVSLGVNWLIGGALATVGSIIILWLINAHKLTHIASSSSLSPYGLVHSFHDLALSCIFSVLGFLTNFGANPVFDTSVLRSIPHQLHLRLLSLGGLAFLINAAVLAIGLLAVWRLIKSSLAHNRDEDVELDHPSKLAVALIWTSLAAFVIFILSRHYYPADARYLTLSLFAIFVALAAFIRKKEWRPEQLVLVGLVVCLGILAGIPTVLRTYSSDKMTLAGVNSRNSLVLQALSSHPVDLLVGDYWRVIPAKFASGGKLKGMPLLGCGATQNVLSSRAWQPDLNNHSFAYLMSFDRSLTNYQNCTLDQVVKSFGKPNASVLVAGTFNRPLEQVLFYDRGANKSSQTLGLNHTSTVVPITIDQLPYTACDGPTTINVVAHQDDDLLFMSPDLIHDLDAGHCVRTVYVTAGDAGGNQFYWLGRQLGSEAAYSTMINSTVVWIERIVKLNDHSYITVANPKANPKLSLIFMRLPDGGLKGQGFNSSHFESLEKLEAGKITTMHSVSGQSYYSSNDFINALISMMHTYRPTEIHTQANYVSHLYPDHSDHMAVGRYVKRAYQQYEVKQFENRVIIPIKFYIGYPIRERPANVSSEDLIKTERAFSAYSAFDKAVCQTVEECNQSTTYGSYLKRQYTYDH